MPRKNAEPAIRILLIDDHPIVRDGIASHLTRTEGLAVVAEASNGREAMRLAKEHRPDIIILDIRLPDTNGVDLSKRLRRAVPESRILAFSMHRGGAYAARLARNGVRGYLLKDESPDELVAAIRAVHRGELAFRGEAADAVLAPPDTAGAPLSERETEVLALIADGLSSKEIAWRLKIGVRTVESHRRRLMEKLDRRTIAELTKYAIEAGLTSVR